MAANRPVVAYVSMVRSRSAKKTVIERNRETERERGRRRRRRRKEGGGGGGGSVERFVPSVN